jgi:DNA modification methylase
VIKPDDQEYEFCIQSEKDADVWEAFSMNYFQARQQESSEGIVHPTMKPVNIIELALANSTQEGDVVYDPFAGSGSTLIACEKLKRVCRAVEISPRYVDVAVKRWEEYTGRTAVRLR